MKKTILIAPFEGPFAAALADEARAAGWSVLLARTDAPVQARPAGTSADAADAEAGSFPGPAGSREFAALAWNPSSYISTSALFLSGKNAVGEVDAVVLLSESGAARPDLIEGRPGELEAYLARSAAGPAFLVREAVRGFEARRAPGRDAGRDGALIFVDREVESQAASAGAAAASPAAGPAAGPAAALAAGAFRGLADGVFAMSREASWEAFGVLDRTGDEAELARFVLRLLEAKKSGKSGRWLRHTGKSGLFGKF